MAVEVILTRKFQNVSGHLQKETVYAFRILHPCSINSCVRDFPTFIAAEKMIPTRVSPGSTENILLVGFIGNWMINKIFTKIGIIWYFYRFVVW